jgi:aspartyl-tRNA(Asn)/glutamyl-tRNA(Gln) amidotransferase subunit B
MEFEAFIGMEVHAELLTESKMFCGCSARFGGPPNSNVCPVCLGLPGSLPVPNRKAVEYVVRTALALNCEISSPTIFYRKNYYYPDLPKNYQISQYGDDPIGKNGYLEFLVNGELKRVRIRRVHLEEDTGKLFHVAGDLSQIDYNRSGVPLMEIVTDFPPDIHTAEEAREYLVALRTLLVYLGVCDGKMEEGSLRCEPNISIRIKGEEKFNPKVELKNLNSFRAVYRGIEYELKRQAEVLSKGGKIVQETRRWDDARGETFVMRSKEFEQDYRYFPEPDLVPLTFEPAWLDAVRESLPELPLAKRNRYQQQYGLPAYDAEVLTEDPWMARFFEEAAEEYHDPKAVANWVMGDMMRLLKENGADVRSIKVTPAKLVKMLKLIDAGTISGKIAKQVFQEMFATGKDPEEVVREKGLTQITDEATIASVVEKVLADNPKEVERYRAGEGKLMAFFVGQVMRATKGKANPELVNRMLAEKLSGSGGGI